MRTILCFLLALVATPAWAEWVKVSVSDTSIFYIDPASIRKDGNLRKVWRITDLKQRHKDGEMSIRGLDEYDCKEERLRFLALSSHSETMAGGETLWSKNYSDGEWQAIPPGSTVARVLKIVCASVAAPDLAKWVKVAESDKSIRYIDPASIRKDGNLRKVWVIHDPKQRNEDGVMSRRGLEEYDCKEERRRTLSLSTHSDPMAGGLTLWSNDDPGTWSATQPGSISESVLKIVCAK